MARRIAVVVSQGQSNHPTKRQLEEEIVTALLLEPGIDVTVIPNLYDLSPDGTGMLALSGIGGDMVVLAWLYPRAAHWTLDRFGIHGTVGESLLKSADDEEDEDDDDGGADLDGESTEDRPRVAAARAAPHRKIYCIDLRASGSVPDYVHEIKRIAAENSTQVVDLMSWVGGSPREESVERYLNPTNDTAAGPPPAGNGQGSPAPEAQRIQDDGQRRWYPVIDFSRCTNCMECIDFCLFGVYGVDGAETILVEQPDNCRKGCPACSRVCPENAIIFPQHKTPAIAGAAVEAAALKIDLSQLFGAPDAVEVAARERDEQLVLAGRDAVGMSVGIAKRQADKPDEPKDELDNLLDELDDLDL